MYPERVRREALDRLAAGAAVSVVSRELAIARSTLRSWTRASPGAHKGECPRCDGAPLAAAGYAALLGFYLGDGCVSVLRTYAALRVSCDAAYPEVVADVERLLQVVRPGVTVFRVRAPGVVVVQAHWKHWPCLFPQHGPGRKHERPIVLEGWQRDVVAAYPGDFLRGLFHSDGARVENWATRVVAGERRRYAYPRWQLSNRSEDILGLGGWALDLAGVAWRRSSRTHVSVSRRDAVARLDALVGRKA